MSIPCGRCLKLPLSVQVSPGLCRRLKPWTICVRWTWSSAWTSPTKLCGRDWATAGSIQPAVESTTWASTRHEWRSKTSRSYSAWNILLWPFCGTLLFLEDNLVLSASSPQDLCFEVGRDWMFGFSLSKWEIGTRWRTITSCTTTTLVLLFILLTISFVTSLN